MEILKKYSTNHGVFYPLQTFSKNKSLLFEGIPLLVEGSSPGVEKSLLELGEKISGNVHLVHSQGRRTLHLAAVFACNFSNYLYSVASDLLKEQGLSFDLLKPLIRETAMKLESQSPAEAQTGPAARGDMNIIARHLEMLSGKPQLEEIYKILSQEIGKTKDF